MGPNFQGFLESCRRWNIRYVLSVWVFHMNFRSSDQGSCSFADLQTSIKDDTTQGRLCPRPTTRTARFEFCWLSVLPNDDYSGDLSSQHFDLVPARWMVKWKKAWTGAGNVSIIHPIHPNYIIYPYYIIFIPFIPIIWAINSCSLFNISAVARDVWALAAMASMREASQRVKSAAKADRSWTVGAMRANSFKAPV